MIMVRIGGFSPLGQKKAGRIPGDTFVFRLRLVQAVLLSLGQAFRISGRRSQTQFSSHRTPNHSQLKCGLLWWLIISSFQTISQVWEHGWWSPRMLSSLCPRKNCQLKTGRRRRRKEEGRGGGCCSALLETAKHTQPWCWVRRWVRQGQPEVGVLQAVPRRHQCRLLCPLQGQTWVLMTALSPWTRLSKHPPSAPPEKLCNFKKRLLQSAVSTYACMTRVLFPATAVLLSIV